MVKRKRKHETAFAVLVATLATAAYCLYLIVHHEWNTAVWTACVVVAVPALLFAIKAPTTCGIETRKGHPCPNPSYSVLFGCGSAEGHTLAKLFARLGGGANRLEAFVIRPLDPVRLRGRRTRTLSS